MKKKMIQRISFLILALVLVSITACCKQTGKEKGVDNIFIVENPDYKASPLTGMTRQHWVDAATYLLDGAFSYINDLDDPMKFPKQSEKAYPRNEGQVPTEKLEGLCRTLFVAAPLLRENPDLTLNNIKVADYYQHQILNLINPESPSYIKHRAPNGGPSQNLVEFGALAISLSVIPEILWTPMTQEQKDALAGVMLSYGDGPTVDSNWKFFNIFVLSFFKDQGYKVNEGLLIKYLDESLAFYRGQGWYNDNPAYDYYSMWAFQMYGPVWSELYGKRFYPEYAEKFMSNLRDLADNYPYMFNKDGKMIMWGRSITYRFGAIVPFPMLGFLNDESINYGWMRYIASSTLSQFLQNPEFLEDSVPSLGFYGAFEPAVQIYSCRGSVYWCGKAFLGLLLPEDNIFWTATENRGAWEQEIKEDNVYNRFQGESNLMITNYANIGASEIRSWCHEKVADDWQLWRSTENYNKLSYNSQFPWMADGKNGEVSMNYAVKNKNDEWEVLRLYTFKKFEDEIYYRDAVLETDENVKFQLAEIPLPNGILRVDKVSSPTTSDIRLGHYSLPEIDSPISQNACKIGENDAYIIANGKYQLAMISLEGWTGMDFIRTEGLHPVSDFCEVIVAKDVLENEKIYVTLELWKEGNKAFSKKDLSPVKSVNIAADNSSVEIEFSDNTKKIISFN